MVFSDDTIIMSLLQRFDNEDDTKDEILKYVTAGLMNAKRPEEIEASKVDATELDQVRERVNSVGEQSNRQCTRHEEEEADESNGSQRKAQNRRGIWRNRSEWLRRRILAADVQECHTQTTQGTRQNESPRCNL